ncbi:MAG: HAMP domain-containing histidine kinase [Silicimonas sp.]|nr:HAMP domain-containing histidine kinase [Silicimonas sp.]
MMLIADDKRRMTRGISARGVFLAVLALSLAGIVALSFSVLQAAKRSEARLVSTIEARLLTILEEDGLSGLAFELDRLDRALVPGSDRIEVAAWQVRPQSRRLIRETEPGAAAAFLTDATEVALNGQSYRLRAVDVAAASGTWALPMADVDLRFAVAIPTQETRAARTNVRTIAGAYLLAVLLSLLFHLDHRQRYLRGLGQINGLLDRYSNGETGIRIDPNLPAPELRVLGRHLNRVLPKLDALMEDLRNTSAHLAHELKNPLQAIRSAVYRYSREEDAAEQARIARAIDRTIDQADGRLDTVMQLFRLQSETHVARADVVTLGEMLVDLTLDREEALVAQGRKLEIEVDETLRLTANRHLIDLLLENLLGNAAKYAAPGGEIRVSLAEEGRGFRLRIDNSGTLSAAARTDFTQRFAQGDAHASRTGAGLGLSLVATIARVHGFGFSLQNAGDAEAPLVRAELTWDGGRGDV